MHSVAKPDKGIQAKATSSLLPREIAPNKTRGVSGQIDSMRTGHQIVVLHVAEAMSAIITTYLNELKVTDLIVSLSRQ